jgi:hypothetical protein
MGIVEINGMMVNQETGDRWVVIDGRRVYDRRPLPNGWDAAPQRTTGMVVNEEDAIGINGIVVNEDTGERFLLEDGQVVRRLGVLTRNIAPTCHCGSTRLLKPDFQPGFTGNRRQPTRQAALPLPTMNDDEEDEEDDDEVPVENGQQAALPLPSWNDQYTTNPERGHGFRKTAGRLINTREPVSQQQEALIPPGDTGGDDEE